MQPAETTHKPWTVAWAAFGLAVAAWGLGFYGPAVFIKTLHTREGWSISALSTAVSFHFLLSSALIFCLPLIKFLNCASSIM